VVGNPVLWTQGAAGSCSRGAGAVAAAVAAEAQLQGRYVLTCCRQWQQQSGRVWQWWLDWLYSQHGDGGGGGWAKHAVWHVMCIQPWLSPALARVWCECMMSDV